MEWAFLPSPSTSEIAFGPLTLHFYALCIITGIVVAVLWGEKRFVAAGGAPGVVTDVAYWAVPSGIIGGRLYHLATTWESNRTFIDAIAIWRGGLGIWGAISMGAGGAYLRYRLLSKKIHLGSEGEKSAASFAVFMDALAPGIVVAQALGRWGNWFNIELFGRPFTAPWALEVPFSKRPDGFESFATFHPTFLYESLWCFLVALLLIWIGRGSFLRDGGLFLLYICAYCFGRLWIEVLRIDQSEQILGLRLNIWVSAILLVLSSVSLLRFRRGKPSAR